MIPRIIHKVIIVDSGKKPVFPDGMKRAIETWYRMNPEYKIKIYSGDDCISYIKENFDHEVLESVKYHQTIFIQM
jgi:mannosyltransferase OCH1-like enzyme